MTSPKTSRKNKADLKPNGETFRLLFVNHPIPMWVYDLKTLAFLDVNDAAQEKYGYTRDEFLALTIKDIRPAEDVERLINNLEKKRPALQHSGEWRHRLKNGQLIEVEITSHTLDFERHKAALVMAQDITERKLTENALRESEDKFKNFFEFSNIGKSITLLSGGMSVNQAFCDLVGYTRTELQNKKWQEITHPDDIELTQKEVAQLLSGEQDSTRFNKRFIHKNGSVVWVDLSSSMRRDKDGKPLYLMSSVIDVTEHKQMEMKLIQSEAKFRSIFDQSPVGSVIVGLDKRFIRCNSAFCNFLGYQEQELIGKTISDITHPEDLEIGMKELKQMVEGKLESFTGQKRYLRKDGATVWAETSIRLVRDVNNKPLFFLPIIQNITERKQAEDALKDSEKRFATVFRANPAAIAMTRIDDGHLVDVNAAWQRMTGYLHTEVVGRTPQELNLWAKPEQREHLIQALGEQGRAQGEMQLRCKSGEVRDLLMSVEMLELNGNRFLLTMAQDVTERKLTEEKLKESLSLLRIAEKSAKLGGWSVDLETNRITWSDEVAIIHETPLGFSPSVEEGISFYAPEWRERISKAFGDCAQTGIPYNEELEIISAKGKRVWVQTIGEAVRDDKGKVIKVHGAFQDISARKQAEKALRETSEQLSHMLANSPTVIYALKVEDGKANPVWVSNNIESILGFSAEDGLQPEWWTQQIYPEDQPEALASLEHVFDDFYQHEYRFLHKDGHLIWLHDEHRLLRDVDNKPWEIVGAWTDITARKQAEVALAESEKKFRALFETMSEGIVYEDHGGKIISANPAAERLLGLSFDQMQGRTSVDLRWKAIHEDGSPFPGETHSLNLAAKTGKLTIGEMMGIYNPKSDAYVWLSVNSTPEFLPGEKKPYRAYAVFRDITERRQAEEKLREHEQTLRSFIANSPDTMYLLDLESHTSKYLNCEEFCGYPRSTLESPASIMFALHSDDGPAVRANWQQMLRASNDDVTTCEYRLQRKDGNWEWIQQRMTILSRTVDGKPSQVLVTLSIITERKQAEEKLRESERQLREAQEMAHLGFWRWDIKTGDVEWSDEVFKIFCLDPKEFTPQIDSILALSPWPEDHQRDKELIDRAIETHSPGSYEQKFLRPDQSIGHYYSTFQGNYAENGDLISIVGTVLDITERKQAEDALKEYNTRLETAVEARTSELREAQEKLVRNEKLAVLGQLAGGVGHELRNPLAVINNAVYYLKLIGADSSEKVKEYLGIIQNETHTCEKIITDLLDFARVKSVDVEPVSVSKLAARVLERYPAPETVNVRLEIPENLRMIYVDPRQMEQVLGNLVINACQAMSEGGELTISAHQEQEMIAISVQDTGVGIPPENMKKLFEPLFTTKAKGIGLGLAVSQKLIEANGGRIEVESEAGVGSTFTVYLPVKQ